MARNIYFGDSMTAPNGNIYLADNLCPYYPYLLACLRAEFDLKNYASSANSLADQASAIYQNAQAAGLGRIHLLCGTEDRRVLGSGTAAISQFKKILGAELRFMGGTVLTAPSMTLTGAWSSNPTAYGVDIPRYSVTTGDYATGSFTGDVLAICATGSSSWTFNFSVYIDGSSTPAATFNVAADTGAIASALSIGYAPFLFRVSGCGAGSHTFKIMMITGGSGAFELEWVAASPGSIPVYVLNLPYVAYGIETNVVGANAQIDAYNTAMNDVVTQARSDGYTNIHLVDINSIIDPNTMMFATNAAGADYLHPGAPAHLLIASKLNASY